MRTTGLKLGDLVVKGTRNEREQGTGGTLCIALTVGRFTTTRTPCGWAVVPYAKADRKVCIAEPEMELDRERGVKVMVWKPRLVSPSSLIAHDEWRIKNNAIRKQQKEMARHQERGRKLRDAAAEAVRKKAKAPVRASVNLSVYPHRGKDRKLQDATVSVKVPVADMKDLPAVKKWLDFLAEPAPDECVL